MTQAWREAGEAWKAVSSRVVTARLKLSSNRPSRAHLHQTEVYPTVISVYAPTHRATPDEKGKFFDTLQDTIDSVSDEEALIVVGDWNARVGGTERSNTDRWWWEGGINRYIRTRPPLASGDVSNSQLRPYAPL